MNKLSCCVAVAVAGLGGAAVGDVFNVPGDFPTIQGALLAALDGDEIIVAPGTYNEAIFFNGHDVTLRSSDGPDVSIIDATGISNHVARVILGEGPASRIEGFTFTGATTGGAAGLQCIGSSPTVTNCRFTGNPLGMELQSSSPSIIGCTFDNNSGTGLSATNNSNPTVTDCTFSGNGDPFSGGGMSLSASSPTVTNCIFRNNLSNTAGGGVAVGGGNPTFRNCLFFGNTGNNSAISINSATVTLLNCTLSGNVGGIATTGPLTLTNCIIWDNGPLSLSGGPIAVSYCDIEFGWPGSDFSILADPMFVDPLSGNYRLQADSPCIDLGNNAGVPVAITTDLDGNPRFVDRPATPDCPQPGADCGLAPIVDMGAYEWACPLDIDGDGTVAVPDLLALLAAWGTNPGGPPDFDGDGLVGVPDLLILLAAWGPCP